VKTDFERELRARHPKLREAILADARVSLSFRGRSLEGLSDRDVLIEATKLAWRSGVTAVGVPARIIKRGGS
jgi:hypothetical protein